MSIRAIHGDCRDVLKTLPSESVHCVVCSPPYYGLRDYGTGQWDGGESGCDHAGNVRASDKSTLAGYTSENVKMRNFGMPFVAECGKCGARRRDSQIGLETTPDAYVAELVAVFREVRRILRPDGVVFLNLGDSYASSAMGVQRVQPSGRQAGAGQGDVQPVLSPDGTKPVESGEPGTREGKSRRVASSTQRTTQRPDNGAAAEPESKDYRNARSEVPLLWGDDADLSDDRSRSERWGEGPSSEEAFAAQQNNSRRVSTRPLSNSLLELQCGEGNAGSLSAFGGLKPKDLLGIPWAVAFALRADGWWLRQDIIWSKPNPMPESVRDRCTKAHEYIFLLSKSPKYFWDAQAIAEEAIGPAGGNIKPTKGAGQDLMRTRNGLHLAQARARENGGFETRNKRSVWEVATQPFSEAHFATFPPALIEPCIKAGCPAKACATCGKPWVRETDGASYYSGDDGSRTRKTNLVGNGHGGSGRGPKNDLGASIAQTIGFSPSCSCNAATVPGVVLDPFSGAGTTGLVADRLGRDAILIELNADYSDMSRRRIHDDAPLFVDVSA